MLKLLDKLLRDLLVGHNIGLTPSQIWFEPPVPNWRSALGNTNDIALNIYLVDLRENRKLRSNERGRTDLNGVIIEQPAPARMDCHYLISAWHPGLPPIEPTQDEHLLLYNVAAILVNQGALNPSRVYTANPLPPDDWPLAFFDADFPIIVGPVEGFAKLSEFWTSMGSGSFWRPVLYLVVTVPIELVQIVAGPMVTTRITEYRQYDRPETAEVWVQIGGTVLDSTGNAVAKAWVRLETTSAEPLQTTETDIKGRFTFSNLRAGRYQLNVRASGLGELKPQKVIDVPSPTGEYDVKYP